MTRTPERYLLRLRLRDWKRREGIRTATCHCGRAFDPRVRPLACSSSCVDALRHRRRIADTAPADPTATPAAGEP